MGVGRDTAAVALGSGVGALARYGAATALGGAGFPWGTLAVNVAGSFLIGLLAALTAPGGRLPAGPAARFFLMAGFCGGFTTFSTFALDAFLLLGAGAQGAAAAYVAATAGLALAGVAGGWRLGLLLGALAGRDRSSH